jgi:plastocyanin
MPAKKTLDPGDTVRWDHSQGTTTGHVVRKQTTPTKIEGHKVAASKDTPEYVVKSDKTGALAAHKPEELRKR